MYGVIAAYLLFKRSDFWTKYKYTFLVIGTALIILLYLNPFNWKNIYPPILFNIESITTFCFIPFLSSVRSTKFVFWDSFFIFISIISYSMYLLHNTVIQKYLFPILESILSKINLTTKDIFLHNYIAYWILTIVCSYCLYALYEHPITRLRDKIKIK